MRDNGDSETIHEAVERILVLFGYSFNEVLDLESHRTISDLDEIRERCQELIRENSLSKQ